MRPYAHPIHQVRQPFVGAAMATPLTVLSTSTELSATLADNVLQAGARAIVQAGRTVHESRLWRARLAFRRALETAEEATKTKDHASVFLDSAMVLLAELRAMGGRPASPPVRELAQAMSALPVFVQPVSTMAGADGKHAPRENAFRTLFPFVASWGVVALGLYVVGEDEVPQEEAVLTKEA